MIEYMMICALVVVIGAMSCTIRRICKVRLVSGITTVGSGLLSLWLLAIALGFVDLGIVFPAVCSIVAVMESIYCNSENKGLGRMRLSVLRNGFIVGLVAFAVVLLCSKMRSGMRIGVVHSCSAEKVKTRVQLGDLEKLLGITFVVGVPDMPGLSVKELEIPQLKHGVVQSSLLLVSDGAPRPIVNQHFDYKYICRRKSDDTLYDGKYYKFFEGDGARDRAIDAANKIVDVIEQRLGCAFNRSRLNAKLADQPAVDADNRFYQFAPDHAIYESTCELNAFRIAISVGITDNGCVLLVLQVNAL